MAAPLSCAARHFASHKLAHRRNAGDLAGKSPAKLETGYAVLDPGSPWRCPRSGCAGHDPTMTDQGFQRVSVTC